MLAFVSHWVLQDVRSWGGHIVREGREAMLELLEKGQ